MRMTSQLLVHLALIATTLAAVPTRVVAQAADSGAIALHPPDSIAAFQLVDRQVFPERSEGVMLRYRRADSLTADVFVYPGPDFSGECDMPCARGVLVHDGDGFIAVFPEMVRRGYVDTISVDSDSSLVAAAGSPWRLGRHLHLRLRQDGVAKWSDFYLYYLPGYRVKVRSTYLPVASVAAAVAQFAVAAGPAFGDAVRTSPADAGQPINISATVKGEPGGLYRTLLALLAARGYAIADSSVTAGKIVTAPRYTWPAGSEKESWHGAESPGVRLSIVVASRGDSTAVDISAQSPARPAWKDAGVAATLQLLSAMEIATALSKRDGATRPK